MKKITSRGFSVILPTRSAVEELRVCLKSLKKNSRLNNEYIILVDPFPEGDISQGVVDVIKKYGFSYIFNKKKLGPYRAWNKGAMLATKEILCFITDDQYFAPGWDKSLLSYMKEKRILTSVLVEPGVSGPRDERILVRNFGIYGEEFKEEKFLRFFKEKKKAGLGPGMRWLIPLVIRKKEFFALGKFPLEGKDERSPDILLIDKAKKNGFEVKTVLSSFSYHFQSSSWIKRKRLVFYINQVRLFLGKRVWVKPFLRIPFLRNLTDRIIWGYFR